MTLEISICVFSVPPQVKSGIQRVSAWRLPFPRRRRSVLHSFSPRNTEGLTHFQRISMWPQGQSHNHGVLMCPALCHCQKLMRLTQCPCPCQVYGHLKGLQPLACSDALLFTNSACSPSIRRPLKSATSSGTMPPLKGLAKADGVPGENT